MAGDAGGELDVFFAYLADGCDRVPAHRELGDGVPSAPIDEAARDGHAMGGQQRPSPAMLPAVVHALEQRYRLAVVVRCREVSAPGCHEDVLRSDQVGMINPLLDMNRSAVQ